MQAETPAGFGSSETRLGALLQPFDVRNGIGARFADVLALDRDFQGAAPMFINGGRGRPACIGASFEQLANNIAQGKIQVPAPRARNGQTHVMASKTATDKIINNRIVIFSHGTSCDLSMVPPTRTARLFAGKPWKK